MLLVVIIRAGPVRECDIQTMSSRHPTSFSVSISTQNLSRHRYRCEANRLDVIALFVTSALTCRNPVPFMKMKTSLTLSNPGSLAQGEWQLSRWRDVAICSAVMPVDLIIDGAPRLHEDIENNTPTSPSLSDRLCFHPLSPPGQEVTARQPSLSHVPGHCVGGRARRGGVTAVAGGRGTCFD